MTREAIQRRALQLAAVEAAERQHDRHFDMHGDDAVAEGVDRREQRGEDGDAPAHELVASSVG